jgi:glycosyltransferase involved in cell wall biosynthesis
MAEAVLVLLDDGALRAKLGQGARRHIREQLTWERLSERVERAYLAGKQKAS